MKQPLITWSGSRNENTLLTAKVCAPSPPIWLQFADFLTRQGESKWSFTHAYLTAPSRPLFVLSLLAPILSFPPGEERVRDLRAATSAAPLSPPSLIFVVLPFETSISRRTKEWWSMCNKCRCHGNPRFGPKISLFIPFEDLSPGRGSTTRPWGPAMTKPIFCLLLDWLKKTFLVKNHVKGNKKWHGEERDDGSGEIGWILAALSHIKQS